MTFIKVENRLPKVGDYYYVKIRTKESSIEKTICEFIKFPNGNYAWDYTSIQHFDLLSKGAEVIEWLDESCEIISVKDQLPNIECGSFLVYAPKSFPKNSRWLVAEYYDDVKGFYSESGEDFLDDVTHWTKLPDEPN